MKVQAIREVLEELGVTPRKSRGQNFLINDERARSIVAFAEITPETTVLEIGPGLGALTMHLQSLGKQLVLVEKEYRFAERLRTELADCERPVTVLNEDIRAVVLSDLAISNCLVISNVPYSVSSEVVLWTVRQRACIDRASFLLQREFAERIGAEPGCKAYGSLSVLTSVFFRQQLGAIVAGNEFFPPAEVESRLLRLDKREVPLLPLDDTEFFEKVVRSCFQMRRKTLVNNLLQAGWVQNKEEAAQLIARLSLRPDARAEMLTVLQFGELTKQLSGKH